MTDKLKYEEIYPQSREEVVDALDSSDSERIGRALYSAAKYEEDWRWTQERCLALLRHSDRVIRWAAALSLSYIAVFQGHLDVNRVLPELHKAKADPAIASIVEDSLENISAHVKLPRQELVDAFGSNDIERIKRALHNAPRFEEDWRWTQEQCLTLLHHFDPEVRSAASYSLSDIAIFQGHLDVNRVLPGLHKAKADPAVGSIVEDSLRIIKEKML